MYCCLLDSHTFFREWCPSSGHDSSSSDSGGLNVALYPWWSCRTQLTFHEANPTKLGYRLTSPSTDTYFFLRLVCSFTLKQPIASCQQYVSHAQTHESCGRTTRTGRESASSTSCDGLFTSLRDCVAHPLNMSQQAASKEVSMWRDFSQEIQQQGFCGNCEGAPVGRA